MREWDAQRRDLIRTTRVGSDSISPGLPPPPAVVFPGPRFLQPANFRSTDATGFCADSIGLLPPGFRDAMKPPEGHLQGAALPAHLGLCWGRTQRPAVCALLPAQLEQSSTHYLSQRGSHLLCRANRELPGVWGAGGPGSRAGPGCSCQGRRGLPKRAGAGGARPAGAGASVTSPGGPPLSGAEGRPGAFLGPGGSSCIGGWREVPAANQGQAVLTVSSGRHVKAPQRSWEFK